MSNNDFLLFKGDCLSLLAGVQDKSVDMVCADLPYGTTSCKWDTVIPLPPLWEHYKRVVKDNGAIVLTSAQPFTSMLISSNLKAFKYGWIYEKTNPKGFLSAKKRPLTAHENVLVFSFGTPPYYPQKWKIPEHLRTKRKHATTKSVGECYGNVNIKRWDDDGSRFPTSVIGFSNRAGRHGNLHPTQKPVELIKYLISTYTNSGEVVLDNCMGSGTTGVACLETSRKFIGIEKDEKYFEIARNRIEKELSQGRLW